MKQYLSVKELRKVANGDVTGYDPTLKPRPYSPTKIKALRDALRDAANQIEQLKLQLGFNDSSMGIMQDRIDRLTKAMFHILSVTKLKGEDVVTTGNAIAGISEALNDEKVFSRFESAYEEVRTGVIVEKNPCSEIALKPVDSLPFDRFLNPGNKLP